jgi:hypothetical protein
MSLARIRLAVTAAVAGSLVFGGLVVTPAAQAAITASQITTPSNPSFFIADEDASSQTFGIAGTTTGGNPATNKVDVNCYWGASFVTVAHNVPLNSDGSFSIAKADLNEPLDLTCQLRAVPAGSNPSDLTPFAGPVIGVGERDSDKVAVGPNTGKITGYYLDAQQKTAAFDYVSLGNCGLDDGYLYDSTFAQTTTTFACGAALFMADSVTTPARSEIRIDGTNAYDPFSAGQINPNAPGLPSLTDTYTVDKATGNVVIHEKDPLVTCPDPTFPPNQVSCASFVSAGVTDNRTITQDHDGHVSSITDSFASSDGKAHALDLLWDNSQHFWGASGDSTQVEYEFPGQSSFSTHALGDNVTLPSSAGTILVRMHGAADGDTGTGQGAIVYDRPASAASFTLVQSFASEFTLHQTGTVPAGGTTKFRFAFVQDFQAASVASMAKAATKNFLDTISVSKSGNGRGKVTSSPAGIACGKACKHGYADGTSVALKAKAAGGSKFSGWSGACTGTHSCKITANDNVTVKARFVLKPCVVPNLQGKTLKAAKLSLEKAFCSLGKVTTAASSTVAKGLVLSQNPKQGKRVKQHTKVNLVLSAG